MIATVFRKSQVCRILGIEGGGFEIKDGIEPTAFANPFVDGLASAFSFRSGVGRAAKWQNRAAVDTNIVRVRTHDDLLIGLKDVVSESVQVAVDRASTEIVYAFEDDEPPNARLRQNVAVEAREGVRAEAVAE